jgi:hypothetical protein
MCFYRVDSSRIQDPGKSLLAQFRPCIDKHGAQHSNDHENESDRASKFGAHVESPGKR